MQPTVSVGQAVGEHVRIVMKRRHVTQAHMAARLGMSQAGVSRRLVGQVDFTVTELAVVADVLGVPTAELLPAAVA